MSRISGRTMRACYQRLSILRARHNLSELPIDIVSIARELGVRTIEPAHMKVDGYVGLAANGGLVIRYRRGNSSERDRFTIAHEIGHLLIAEATGVPITTEKTRTGFNSEESAANQLAAEVLMPADILLHHLRGRSPSWGWIQEIRKVFKVSAYALLRRLTEIDGAVSVFATFDCQNGKVNRWGFCNATSEPQLTFASPFQEFVEMHLNHGKRNSFYVPASVAGIQMKIPCEVRLANHSHGLNSWVFGWTVF